VLKAGDVVTPTDLDWLGSGRGNVTYALRPESDTREVLVLSFDVFHAGGLQRPSERRIDLATTMLLDDRIDLYPVPRLYVTPRYDGVPAKPYGPPPPDCAAAFQRTDLLRVDTERLFDALTDARPPQVPVVARQGRTRGMLPVEVIVSETGSVLCARQGHLLFAADDAAAGAVRSWRFRPFRVEGQPVKAIGELLFHLEDVDPIRWDRWNARPFRTR
jgi:hypothetical protein